MKTRADSVYKAQRPQRNDQTIFMKHKSCTHVGVFSRCIERHLTTCSAGITSFLGVGTGTATKFQSQTKLHSTNTTTPLTTTITTSLATYGLLNETNYGRKKPTIIGVSPVLVLPPC